jgi:hypothetical protein
MDPLDTLSLGARAPTMGRLEKIRYSHEDMIDYLIANPSVTQDHLAARYGYSVAWVCNIMASDAWKARYAARRAEIVDPGLLQTVEDRFRGLAEQSLAVLQKKLAAPQVSDATVLKAVELGAKGIGLGGFGTPTTPPAPVGEGDRLDRLAVRLLALQRTLVPARKESLDVQDAQVLPAAQPSLSHVGG